MRFSRVASSSFQSPSVGCEQGSKRVRVSNLLRHLQHTIYTSQRQGMLRFYALLWGFCRYFAGILGEWERDDSPAPLQDALRYGMMSVLWRAYPHIPSEIV